MSALQAGDVGSNPIDSINFYYYLLMLAFPKIMSRGLTLIVKNDNIYILYLDKKDLFKKFI